MISRTTIDKVFEAARVEEVIGDYIQLKRSGSNLKGLSPFTDERTPSFMVSPAKQIWKDFSSGKGGNAVSFLMEHEHFTYPEAIRHLAKRYGIEVEETEQTAEDRELVNERESLYLINEFAKTFFQNTMHSTEEGKAIGLSYFKERGFTTETMQTFELGYSPEKWEAFTENAIKKGYTLENLEKVGLTVVRNNKQFDRFRARVIFPIKSMSGRTLGFGGRILSNQAKAAKYLNSPESIIYDKSKILYGLFTAKQSIAKEDNCYLVEGYTDVIQMYQRGITNVVSSSGTALTPDQIRLISRLTKNVTLLFDGDDAGLRAAIRGVDIILEQGMNVQICTFPKGEDPDSFAQKNSLEDIQKYFAKNSKDFISFKASMLAEEVRNNPVQRAETIREVVESIAKIPDLIKQELYIQDTAKTLDISEEVLFSTLAQINQANKRRSERRPQREATMQVVEKEPKAVEKVNVQQILERKILEILLLYGEKEETFEAIYDVHDEEGGVESKKESYISKVYKKIYLDLHDDEIEFTDSVFRVLYEKIINEYNQKGTLEPQHFIQELAAEETAIVSDILMEEERYDLHDWERADIFVKDKDKGIVQLVKETILSLRANLLDKKIAEMAELLQDTEVEAETKQQQMEAIKDYLKLKTLLANNLDRVI
ncbi:MAG TPA: DNA primase [Flavobacteriaceae bacterium]|nr:DNA primase [Flavobacteriaceae bacterium]